MSMSLAQKIGCVTGLALAMSAGAAQAAYGYNNPYNYSNYNDPYRNDNNRYDDRYGGNNIVRCESRDRRTVYCGYNLMGGVRLVNRMSQASCVRGRSWGVDRGRLWVSSGCRAQFQIDADRYGSHNDNRYDNRYDNRNGNGYGYGNGYDNGYGNGGGRVMICESREGRYNFCAGIGGYGQVQIRRQLSSSRCLQNSSWGYRNGGIWVDRGCRAEFVVY